MRHLNPRVQRSEGGPEQATAVLGARSDDGYGEIAVGVDHADWYWVDRS